MAEPTITCPKCQSEIKLTESLAAPLIEATRRDFGQRLDSMKAEMAGREAALRAGRDELAKAREAITAEVEDKLKCARTQIEADAAKRARLALAGDIEQKSKEIVELQDVLKQREGKLAEAQRAQADLLRKQRELDDARREFELTVETRVQQGLEATRTQARKDAEEKLNLKVAEREQTITSMQRTIEELQRRAEQGSQQLQGEVQELTRPEARQRCGRPHLHAVDVLTVRLQRGDLAVDAAHYGQADAPSGLWAGRRRLRRRAEVLLRRFAQCLSSIRNLTGPSRSPRSRRVRYR